MMRFARPMLKLPLLVVIAASAFSQNSFAATLNLNYEATAGGTQIYSLTTTTLSASTPTSLTYGNSLFAPTTTIPSTSYGFYDDYVFAITDSNVNSVTATIDLGNLSISDLSERLFSVQGNAEQANGVTTGLPNGSVWQAWTSALQPGGVAGSVAVFNKTGLAAGTYVLQIRGNATGSAGGSYAGTLNVTPVPLPAALPLLISGLGFMGGLFGRRRSAV